MPHANSPCINKNRGDNSFGGLNRGRKNRDSNCCAWRMATRPNCYGRRTMVPYGLEFILSLKGTRRDELWEWCREFHAWLATTRVPMGPWGDRKKSKPMTVSRCLDAYRAVIASPNNRVLIIESGNGTFPHRHEEFFLLPFEIWGN